MEVALSLSAASRHWITALSVGLASFAFSVPAATAAPSGGEGDGSSVTRLLATGTRTTDEAERPTDEDLAPRDRAARVEAERLDQPFGDEPEETTPSELLDEAERVHRALQRRDVGRVAKAQQGLTGSSSISGTVTNASGEGLEQVWVGVFREHPELEEWERWEWLPGTMTGADGTFTVGDLEAGNYRLSFSPSDPYASEYYDDARTWRDATTITIGSAQALTGVDAELALGAEVEGVVSAPAGSDLSSVWVHLLEWDDQDQFWSPTFSTTVSDDGTYRLSGAAAGEYRVLFSPQSSELLEQYYDGVADVDAATPVTLRAGQVQAGIDADLVRASTITGRVQLPAGFSPEDVNVVAYRDGEGEDDWEWAGSTMPALDGSYRLALEGAGRFRVRFDGPDGIVTEYYDDADLFDDATVIEAAQGEQVTGIDATLEQGASIAGVVSGPGGPLQDVTVAAYEVTGEGDDLDWEWVGSAETRADGSYTVLGLGAGRHRVRFMDGTGRHLSEYYDDVASIYRATDLTLARGASLTGINARLAVAGQITGRVTSADDPESLEVVAHRLVQDEDGPWWSEDAYASVDETGAYTLGGLPTGQYRIEFYSYGDSVGEFYDDVPTLEEARTISVTAGSTVSGINASLEVGGVVTGRITVPVGTDTDDLAARLYQWDASDPEDPYWRRTKTAWVDESGTYRASGLRAGAYRVELSDDSGALEPVWFRDASTVEAAQDVVVAHGRETTGIDATLKPWATLSGVVTGPVGEDVGGVEVQVWEHGATPAQDAWWDPVGHATTQEDGSFTVTGLRAGTYAVEFRTNGRLAGEWYQDAADRASAAAVRVAAHTAVTGIRATLDLGSTVRGRVTSASSPVGDVRVSVLQERRWDDFSEWERVSSSYVGQDGSYEVGGLRAGTYKVAFEDQEGDLLDEYYDDAPTIAQAKDVVVGTRTTVQGINADLARASTISGTVRGTFDVDGLEVVALRLVDGEWEWAWSASVREDGTYTIGRLAAGTYRVLFRDWTSGNVSTYYGGALDVESARDVRVGVEQALTGIDATLVPGGKVKGSVTVPDGVRVTGVSVTAYRKVGSEWRADVRAGVNADGTYEVKGLASGTYRIGFEHGDDAVVDEFYDNAATVEQAKDVVVADRATVSGIAAALSTTPPTGPKPEDPKPQDPAPAPKVIKLVKAPKLSGTAKVGKTLKVSKGTWKPGQVTVKYQWFVKQGKRWVVVKKATRPSLKLTRTMKGKQVRVRLTVSAKGYRTLVHTTKASKKIRK
ncbi:carboxypeptidase-like regulatory domain-containing protein [Nocardioides daphniae]|uniref:alpha-amylase n=1 Tax=Nocardioides daphniae TaxID=402297 RepID=A0ABQ1Q147_9ACTN|nr:carboxypeptidase-like regulatory domain-containing protein [Nocardioides daphniae]GGD08731.1 hypothetical protein GCM10007231_04470 [Nocardioides daphniae]